MQWGLPGLREDTTNPHQQKRREGFATSATASQLPKYNAMFDQHLAQLWDNKHKKVSLKRAGFLDDNNSLVDADSHRRKLFVMEQELLQADRADRHRAMDRERAVKDRQIILKRQEMFEKHMHNVSDIREGRKQKQQDLREQRDAKQKEMREAAQAMREQRPGLGTSKSTGSLPAAGSSTISAPPSRTLPPATIREMLAQSP